MNIKELIKWEKIRDTKIQRYKEFNKPARHTRGGHNKTSPHTFVLFQSSVKNT